MHHDENRFRRPPLEADQGMDLVTVVGIGAGQGLVHHDENRFRRPPLEASQGMDLVTVV